MSHLHLDGGRDRNLAAGIGNHLPMGLTELSTMDVFIATSGSGQSETNVTTEPWSGPKRSSVQALSQFEISAACWRGL